MKEDINRVGAQVMHAERTSKEDINRVDAHVIQVETNLKNDIHHAQERTIKWLSLIVAVAVIIIGMLTYIKG